MEQQMPKQPRIQMHIALLTWIYLHTDSDLGRVRVHVLVEHIALLSSMERRCPARFACTTVTKPVGD
jgi:hypothetical protein